MLFQNGFNGGRESFGSGTPLISVMDVLSEPFITYGSIRAKAVVSSEERERYLVEYGDVLFQRSSENQEDAGTSNVYLDQGKSAVFGGFVIRGKRIADYDPPMMKYLLSSRLVRQQITSCAQGAQHINVSQDTLQSVEVFLPSFLEQHQIGAFFQKLDHLITLHQRKYDKLCAIKKSMLDKMFPKPGELVPEIRFEGFTDPWEQCKLGEIGHAQSGVGFPDEEQGGKEGVPFYKVSDMNTLGNETELVNSSNYVTAEQIAKRSWKPVTDVPAMLFAKVGAAVFLDRKRLVRKPFLLDNNTMCYSFNEDRWNTNFGRSQFERINFASLVQVGALPSYNACDVEGIEICIPDNLGEQHQIGTFFSQLDHLITLHQRKLELLKNVKKSLLDKMFV